MMFILIPLALMVVSAIAIAIIVWRKMPYLRKLTPEAHEMGDTVLHDFAPELIDRVQAVPWRRCKRS
jgi:hypothetical protein